jgi:hypothetical protein
VNVAVSVIEPVIADKVIVGFVDSLSWGVHAAPVHAHPEKVYPELGDAVSVGVEPYFSEYVPGVKGLEVVPPVPAATVSV